jgi:5S rRNA maturation endonuclease (ribonuclease M5)
LDKKYIEAIKSLGQEFWGEPTLKNDNEWRFGKRLSKAIDLENATYFDFEENEGGGLIDLIIKNKGLSGKELSNYLYNEFDIGDKITEKHTIKTKERKVVAEYNYRNELNEVRYQVVRYQPKDFRQRHFKDNQWHWGLKDIEPLPYNLPQILEQKDKTIFIVEGEKDADRLMSLGFLATTNSGGSKNWHDSLSKWFKDRRVILIPDNDSAGYLHIEKVANSILTASESVHIVKLEGKVAEKQDISDFIEQGGNLEQLILSAEPYNKDDVNVFPTMAIGDILALKNQKFLIENLIPENGLAVIYGQPASYKTFCALDMSLSIASSRDWQGLSAVEGKTLYVASEGVGGLKKRIKAWLMKNKPETTPNFHLLAQTVNFLDQDELDKLVKTINHIGKDFKLVVIDTVARALSNAGSDENSASDMGAFISSCDYIRENINCAVLVIHHSGKSETAGLRGSSALLGGVDTSIFCKYSKPNVHLEVQKQKDAESLEDIALEVESRALIGETSVTLEKVREDISEVHRPFIPKLGANQKLIYDTIVNVMDSDIAKESWINADVGEKKYITLSHIEFSVLPQLTEKSTSQKNQILKRSILGLQNKDIIGVWNEKIWLN